MKFYREDVRGSVFKLWWELRKDVSALLSSPVVYMGAFLMDIRLGRRCRFNGLPIWQRHPLSVIIVGEGCTFTSNRITNLFGIDRPCIISTHTKAARIEIGQRCGFSGTVIGAAQQVRVGNDVLCGANTLITDFDWHAIDPAMRRAGTPNSNPVIIENNVWLGANVMVMKGVTIGKNSVIGAGSIVTADIPANVIAAGIPCKVLKNMAETWQN